MFLEFKAKISSVEPDDYNGSAEMIPVSQNHDKSRETIFFGGFKGQSMVVFALIRTYITQVATFMVATWVNICTQEIMAS